MAARYGKVEEVDLTEARLFLNYEPETGKFIWKRNKGKYGKAGCEAGYVHKNGYRRVCICGLIVLAHRLAWLFHYGKPPSFEIDHINGNKDDNRINNLRDVNPKTNNQNRIATRPGKSGLVGVFAESSDETSWSAQIGFMGKTIRASSFKSAEEAHEMYIELKKRLHEGYVCHKSEHQTKSTK